MTDGPLRRAAKLGALLVFKARVGLTRWQSRRLGLSTYELGGSCRGSGMCCERPSIRVAPWVWYLPSARRLFLWWQRIVNQFVLVETRSRDRVFVFRCGHFDPISRECDSYRSRPGMCRDYPRVLLEQADPQFFPQCGFYPLDRNRARWTQILETQELDEEQRSRLEEGLFLGTKLRKKNQSGSDSKKTTVSDS